MTESGLHNSIYKEGFSDGERVGKNKIITDIQNIIMISCGNKECDSCKYHYLPDRCEDVYTMDLLNKYFELLERIENE